MKNIIIILLFHVRYLLLFSIYISVSSTIYFYWISLSVLTSVFRVKSLCWILYFAFSFSESYLSVFSYLLYNVKWRINKNRQLIAAKTADNEKL